MKRPLSLLAAASLTAALATTALVAPAAHADTIDPDCGIVTSIPTQLTYDSVDDTVPVAFSYYGADCGQVRELGLWSFRWSGPENIDWHPGSYVYRPVQQILFDKLYPGRWTLQETFPVPKPGQDS